MKVFLGWSGQTSHKVALAFHDWLPKVIQAIRPYISSEDIAKGARWATEIARELESSNYGIIFVTKENADSPWINFEAGALSREIEKSFVSPFLFQLRPAEILGPLAQFQHTTYTKEEVLKLLSTVNSRQALEFQLGKDSLLASFDIWWLRLKDELDKLEREASSNKPLPAKRDPDAMLQELLEMTRALQRETFSWFNKDDAARSVFFAAQENLYRGLAANIGSLALEIDAIRKEMAPIRIPSQGFFGQATGQMTKLSDLLGTPSGQSDRKQANKSAPTTRRKGSVTEET